MEVCNLLILRFYKVTLMKTLEERQEHFNNYVKNTTAKMEVDLLEIMRRESELKEREEKLIEREQELEVEFEEKLIELGELGKEVFEFLSEKAAAATLKRCKEIEDLLDLIHASELNDDNVDMYRAKYIEYTGFDVVPKDVSECEFIEPEPVEAEEAVIVEPEVVVQVDLGQLMSMVEPNPIKVKVEVKVTKGRKKLTKIDHENIIKNLQKDIDNLLQKPYSECIKKEVTSLRRKVSYRKAQIKKLEKGNTK